MFNFAEFLFKDSVCSFELLVIMIVMGLYFKNQIKTHTMFILLILNGIIATAIQHALLK